MYTTRKYLPYLSIFLLIILTVFVWFSVLSNKKEDYMKVVFLDVGQGDAIYIQAPNGKQMLIDGGPGIKTLSSLNKIMPFYDRTIDIIIATHPDLDHIGGLSNILDKFKIKHFIDNGDVGETEEFKILEDKINKNKINKISIWSGNKIILDDKRNIYFEVLYPSKETEKLDSNDKSIIGRLVYKDISFMMMGDGTIYSENQIWWNENINKINSDVLKIGHHGAKTSSSLIWLRAVSPDIAIISSGKNNRYGHPSKEVLNRLDDLKIKYLNTSESGNIILQTNGKNILKK